MSVKTIFFKSVRKHIIILIIGLLFGGLSIAASLLIPFITQAAIDDAIGMNNIALLGKLCVYLFFVSVGGIVFDLLNVYLFTKVSKSFIQDLFHRILSNLLCKKNSFFVQQNSGEINQRINEAWELEDFFSAEFFSCIFSIPTLIAAIIILINTSIEITIVTIIGVLISVFFMGMCNAYIGKNMPHVLDKKVSVSSKIQEMILGVFDIRATATNNLFIDSADRSVKSKSSTSLRFTMGVTTFMRLSSISATLLSVLILYLSGVNIINGVLTIGTYFLIIAYVEKITEPIVLITGLVAQIKPLLVTARRIDDKFNLDNDDHVEEEFISTPLEVYNFLCHIESFQYPNSEMPIISGFNLEAKRGDAVLVQGKNGSGKTTLLNILSGELKNYRGYLLYDGKKGNPRNYMSIVSQTPFIFNFSLRDNIVLSEPFDKSRYDLILERLNIDKYFDKELLTGEVPISENGKSLSGGQKKLIALARCIYRERPILILDEIVSNLDLDLKERVLEYIKTLKKDHIIILVEHTADYDDIADLKITMETKEDI